MAIIIKGFLDQVKLEHALKEIFGDNNWIGSEVNVIYGRRMRWDVGILYENQHIFVEFDGDSHYRSSLQIKRDLEKDQIAFELGFKLIRIPYYVQLTNETFRYYFDFFQHQVEIIQDYPHGWHFSKIYPASFCELGIERFELEFQALPIGVKQQVIESLKERARTHGNRYVMPARLEGLLKI